MASPLSYRNATAADGPSLARWLETVDVDLTLLTPAQRRSVERWRNGSQASFWSVDEITITLKLHPSLVPDEVWCHYNNGRRQTHAPKRLEAA